MATDPSTKTSFSRTQKWGIAFNVLLTALVVLAFVVMMNYLSGRYHKRFYVSTQQQLQLSPRTIGVLKSLTNDVDVVLYYPQGDPLYRTLVDLLKEYKGHTSKLNVRLVDYLRDAGEAQEVKNKYNLGQATNLVIFACEGKPPQIVTDTALTEKEVYQVPSEQPGQMAFDKRTTAFLGEQRFTAALLAATNPKPLKAYYLMGDGEHLVDKSNASYGIFLSILSQLNYVQVEPLIFTSTNTVPSDCNLLIIAGPTDPISPNGLESIENYLNEGGRLFALFNFLSTNREIGLEKILARWGVDVSKSVVFDQVSTSPEARGSDVIVFQFSKHPAVNPLVGRKLQMILPRMISKLELSTPDSQTLKVNELLFSSPLSYATNAPAKPEQALPLMAAVEQDAKGLALSGRGQTRILVTGDSLFLTDIRIGSGANSDFVSLAANWLLERDVLLQGVGPQKVKEYKILMTAQQWRTVRWTLLGAIPGGILLLGGLVWLCRRK